MRKWNKLPLAFVLVAGTAAGQGLPDAPKPQFVVEKPQSGRVVDRRFLAVYGILGAAKAADMWTTSSAISRGCHEANPIFAGPRPSDRRLALTAAGYFAGEVALGYAVKRFGRGHRWTRALWLIEPAKQTEEHVAFAWGNAQRSCRR